MVHCVTQVVIPQLGPCFGGELGLIKPDSLQPVTLEHSNITSYLNSNTYMEEYDASQHRAAKQLHAWVGARYCQCLRTHCNDRVSLPE